MTAVIVTAAPRPGSRTTVLAQHIGHSLRDHDFASEWIDVAGLDLNALGSSQTRDPSVRAAIESVLTASVVVVVTPIFQASYSGLLKLFLDALPRRALAGAVVFAVGSAGSSSHTLALSYALTPVLQALGATRLIAPYCAGPEDWCPLEISAAALTDQAADRLCSRLLAVRETIDDLRPATADTY